MYYSLFGDKYNGHKSIESRSEHDIWQQFNEHGK